MRILGIDPGFGRVGWGVIEQQQREWKHIAHGCIQTAPQAPFTRRLLHIEAALQQLIAQFHPTRGAVEELFFYKNVTTGVHVGHARGVVLLTLAHHQISIHEYTPLHIKQVVTGYGRADKQQMQRMIQMQLDIAMPISSDDAADALCVALACGISLNFEQRMNQIVDK